MIKELHEHDRLFAVLKEHVGLTAARPVGEPIDVGGIAAGAVNQERVDSFLVHECLNRPVSSCYFLIAKRRIVGSLPHASSSFECRVILKRVTYAKPLRFAGFLYH